MEFPDDNTLATEDWVKKIIPPSGKPQQDLYGECGSLPVNGTDVPVIGWFYGLQKDRFRIVYFDGEGKPLPLGHGVKKYLSLPVTRGHVRELIRMLNAEPVNGFCVDGVQEL